MKSLNMLVFCFRYLGVALLLTGCVTTRSISDTASLEKGHGILVAKIKSNVLASLQYVDYAPTSSFLSNVAEGYTGPKGSIKVDFGEQYWALSVPEGKYMWGKVVTDYGHAQFHATNRFEIEPNKINYVGDIELHVSGYSVKLSSSSNPEEMRDYLKKNFPKLFEKFSFTQNFTQFK